MGEFAQKFMSRKLSQDNKYFFQRKNCAAKDAAQYGWENDFYGFLTKLVRVGKLLDFINFLRSFLRILANGINAQMKLANIFFIFFLYFQLCQFLS
jgi:hypothetical protein